MDWAKNKIPGTQVKVGLGTTEGSNPAKLSGDSKEAEADPWEHWDLEVSPHEDEQERPSQRQELGRAL